MRHRFCTSDNYTAIATFALSKLTPAAYDPCIKAFLRESPSWCSRSEYEFKEDGIRFVNRFAKKNAKTLGQLVADEHWEAIHDWSIYGESDSTYTPIKLNQILELTDSMAERFNYPTIENGTHTLVDLDDLRAGAVLKVDTNFVPILRRLVPFSIDQRGMVIKNTKYTFHDGTTQRCRVYPHHIAADFQNKAGHDAGYEFANDDPLDWTTGNLVRGKANGRLQWRQIVSVQKPDNLSTDWKPAQPNRPAGSSPHRDDKGKTNAPSKSDDKTESWHRGIA